LRSEENKFQAPAALEGTLAYIAPEQTGRMNRSLDYRADLYSLGVTLYELFTGVLPHDSSDPLEMVHFHIAGKPCPPRERRASVPEAVNDIVMKLLQKEPENRYQSAAGLAGGFAEVPRSARGGRAARTIRAWASRCGGPLRAPAEALWALGRDERCYCRASSASRAAASRP
jgi:serine/threonine protein kinase